MNFSFSAWGFTFFPKILCIDFREREKEISLIYVLETWSLFDQLKKREKRNLIRGHSSYSKIVFLYFWPGLHKECTTLLCVKFMDTVCPNSPCKSFPVGKIAERFQKQSVSYEKQNYFIL